MRVVIYGLSYVVQPRTQFVEHRTLHAGDHERFAHGTFDVIEQSRLSKRRLTSVSLGFDREKLPAIAPENV
jgi:hypothetical protein